MDAAVRELAGRAGRELAEAKDLEALRTLEVRLLGRKGEVTALLKGLGALPQEARPAAGAAVNRLKAEVAALLESRRTALEEALQAASLAAAPPDPTEPGLCLPRGGLHPITLVQQELEELFGSMGFMVLDGPEVELDYYNFEALNIPADHPARDDYDTFWIAREPGESGAALLLRTHTSPVQMRAMERFRPPIRAVVPGRCFRHEAVDASHEHTFYQMEGLVVDKGISVAHLVHCMRTCLAELLRREVQVRLRPGFFPFVEPGFELDVNCPFCAGTGAQGGRGCPVCKASGWIELLPCGMVHPRVLAAGRIDPEEYTGFAFGMGLQRLVMVRYGIHDIRAFMGGDLRFLEQF